MPPAGLDDLSILGGLLAGFASSLHCVGMCSGIAASLMFTLAPDAGERERRTVILKAQFGRILAYMLAGAVLGAIGSQFYFDADRTEGFMVLRWAGAVTLVYIGLSVAGWAPSLAGLDRVGVGVMRLAQRPVGGHLSAATPIMAGFFWGLLPCGMVYAALFYAMLSGTPGQAAAIMAGFGVGTLPAVLASAFGAAKLMSFAARPQMRLATGLAIASLGILSAALPWKAIAAFCGLPVD